MCYHKTYSPASVHCCCHLSSLVLSSGENYRQIPCLEKMYASNSWLEKSGKLLRFSQCYGVILSRSSTYFHQILFKLIANSSVMFLNTKLQTNICYLHGIPSTRQFTEYSVCEQVQSTTSIRALHHELLYKGQTIKNRVVFMAPHSAIDLPAVIRYLLCYYTLAGHLELVLYTEVAVQPFQLMLNWARSQAVMIRLLLALSSLPIKNPKPFLLLPPLLPPSMWNRYVSTAQKQKEGEQKAWLKYQQVTAVIHLFQQS